MNQALQQGFLFGADEPADFKPSLYPARRVMLESGSEHWCTHPNELNVVREFAPIAVDPFANS